MNILRIIDSQGVSSEYSLDLQEGELLSLGRSETCDISLPEEENLSRTHCHIYCRGGRIFIRDNASVNGILCNNVPVVEAEMHHGQEFVLGLCILSLQSYPYEDIPDARAEEVQVFIPVPPSFSEHPAFDNNSIPDGEALVPSTAEEPVAACEENSFSPASAVFPSSPLPASVVPLREPLPVSASALPSRPALYHVTPAGEAPLSPLSSETPVRVSVKKRRPVASVVPPRQLIHTAAPAPRPQKKYATRSVKTVAPSSVAKKKKRRLSVSEACWMDESDMPLASTGAALGLPVDFGVQLRALVTRYPMRAEDIMALTVAAEEKCYVAVIQYDARGVPSLIVPGSKRDNTAVFPHVLTRFPQSTRADYELVVEEPFGPVHLVLLACSQPCNWFEAYQKVLETSGPAPYPGKLEAAIMASVAALDSSLCWSSSVLRLQTAP